MNSALFDTSVLLPAQQITTTTTGSAIDISNFRGRGKIVLNAGAATAGTAPTLNVKLQHSATSGGSYADVSGAAFSEVTDAADSVQQIAIDWDSLHPFVQVVATVGGTATPTFALSVTADGKIND